MVWLLYRTGTGSRTIVVYSGSVQTCTAAVRVGGRGAVHAARAVHAVVRVKAVEAMEVAGSDHSLHRSTDNVQPR